MKRDCDEWMMRLGSRVIFIGTWMDKDWVIDFLSNHCFSLIKITSFNLFIFHLYLNTSKVHIVCQYG